MAHIPINHRVIRSINFDDDQPAQYMSVKTCILSAGLRDDVVEILQMYVLFMNNVIFHAHQALKYVFLRLFDLYGDGMFIFDEQLRHPDMATLLRTKAFIQAVVQYLASQSAHSPAPRIVPSLVGLLDEYKIRSGFASARFPGTSVTQSATYAANQIHAAYLNNIQANFEDRVLYLLNQIFKVKLVRRLQQAEIRLGNNNVLDDDMEAQIQATPFAQLIKRLKTQIGYRRPQFGLDQTIQDIIQGLPQACTEPFRVELYTNGLTFVNQLRDNLETRNPVGGNYFADVRRHPEHYINTFYWLSRFFADNEAPHAQNDQHQQQGQGQGHAGRRQLRRQGLGQQQLQQQDTSQFYKLFNWYPLRRSWVPSAVQVDTMILAKCILPNVVYRNNHNGLTLEEYKFQLWSLAANLTNAIWQAEGTPDDHGVPQAWPHANDQWRRFCFRGTIFTDGASLSVLKVTRDTNASQPRRPFVPAQRETRYITELTDQEKAAILQNMADHPDTAPVVYVDCGRRDLMYAMAHDSTRNNRRTFIYTQAQRRNELGRTRQRDLLFETDSGLMAGVTAAQLQDVLAAQQRLSTLTAKTQNLGDYIAYLGQQSLEADTLHAWYALRSTRDRSPGERHPLPLYRKLRFDSYIAHQQSDSRLARSIRAKFGNEAVLVMGNWGAPMMRNQEPIRGLGLRRMLKKKGFTVFLIDEFRTSKICPNCLSEPENERQGVALFGLLQHDPQQIENPRPWKSNLVTVWGKLM
ncbi:hypothetical protein BC940DRAFT_306747 [Gongronella butleri]|nr:hypothetical protein BC940DRAFT_306747 [Gongronella butleri]